MQILLILEDTESAKILTFALESQMGTKVSRVSSGNDALTFMLEDNHLDLILCTEVDSCSKLFKYLLSIESDIPLITLGRGPGKPMTAYPDLKVIARHDLLTHVDLLVDCIRQKVKVAETQATGVEAEYCRINTDLLVKIAPLEADVYIRLSSAKFLKLFRKGDTFEHSDLQRYFVQKQVSHLFIRKDESDVFMEKLLATLHRLNRQEPPQEGKAAFDLAGEVQDSIHSLSISLGFNPAVQEMVKENVKLVVRSIRENARLTSLLNDLKSRESGYIANHSIVLSHLTCGIASRMGWVSDSTFEKLTYASLMHDILLPFDDLARFRTKHEVDTASPPLSADDKALVLGHPQLVASHLAKFSELPQDIDTILVQHHERPDGTGFPRGLTSARIAPLSAVFILGHDMVQAYIDEGLEPEGFIAKYKDRYQGGEFKKIYVKLLEDLHTSSQNSQPT